jgi:hypothetical protein
MSAPNGRVGEAQWLDPTQPLTDPALKAVAMAYKAGGDGTMQASADYLGNGAIEINMYENEIADLVRRESVFLDRVSDPQATGHPHRYFEQTAIALGSFTDPRNIAPTATGPTRVERSAMIKALTAQTNLGLFDVEVTRQQGQFASVEAKDIEDIANSIIVAAASGVWTGTDTSLVTPTTPQYVGAFTQVTNKATYLTGTSIIDSIKSKTAQMMANQTYKVRPSAIYLNPLLADFIDREAKAQSIKLDEVVVAGVQVEAIRTQAGRLPLITDPYIPSPTDNSFGFTAPPSGSANYLAMIVTEPWVEMPVINGGTGNKKPRMNQLGLLAGLQGQYVGYWFNTLIFKGASYAHAAVAFQMTIPT